MAHSFRQRMKMENVDSPKIKYFVSVVKQTAMTGESVQINTNLYEGATEEDLKKEILTITHAIAARAEEVNANVLAKTAANLRKQGVDEEEITRLLGEQEPIVE